MSFTTVFKRYELKYIITEAQQKQLIPLIKQYMNPDRYGRTTIANIYFDTDSFVLIRRSLQKPVYKEKLRLRSYGIADKDSTVFAEIKKKYKGIVYKRRLALDCRSATDWLYGGLPCSKQTQISKEIDYFMSYYEGISPKVYLCYDRSAYFGKADPNFRITFDKNILYRTNDLSLTSPNYGKAVLPEGLTLMEVKCAGAMPMFLVRALSEMKVYKTPFSKYGRAYADILKENNNV